MKMIWHQQQLDETPEKKRYWFYRRGWLNINPHYWEAFRWEVCIRRLGFRDGNWFRAMVNLGGEYDRSVQVGLGLLWVSVWLTFPYLLPRKWAIGWRQTNPYRFEDSHGRDYGFYLSDNHLVFKFHASAIGSSSTKDWKWGWTYSCFIDEKILGRRQLSSVIIPAPGRHVIMFSEGAYKLDVSLTRDTWRYQRWPWWPFTVTRNYGRVEVVDPKGIPVPGKGENSWDCGDDALHGLSCPASTPEEAVEAVRRSVIRSRERYGGGEDMYLRRKHEVQS